MRRIGMHKAYLQSFVNPQPGSATPQATVPDTLFTKAHDKTSNRGYTMTMA